MKPLPEFVLTLTLAATALPGQGPAPTCGLPHIFPLPEGEAVTLRRTAHFTGDRTFKIRENYTSQTLIEVDFYHIHSGTDFDIFAEVGEVEAGRIDTTAAALGPFVSAFSERTFDGSIDPGLGIKAIAEDVFGAPPDIDHNGKITILLIDVRDDYVPDVSESYVAGYFDPLDQGQQGNRADIIYLDTNPGSLSGPQGSIMLAALAHEYQHLIHYNRDRREELWVNEGLSELAPVLMGLPHRDFALFLDNTNVSLDSFDGELADYARTGLFFLYTWVQLGTGFIRDLIALTETGVTGFDSALALHGQPALDRFAVQWHLANFIQGAGIKGYGDAFSLPRPTMHEVVTTFPQADVGGNVARLGARWTLISQRRGLGLYLAASRSGERPTLTLLKSPDYTILNAPFLYSAGFQIDATPIRRRQLVVLATASTVVSDSAGYTLYVAHLDDPMIPPAAGFFYPNPFNPQTALSPVTRLLTSPGQVVTLRLYDIRGHEVYRLGPRPAEDNAPLVWNGTLQNGQAAPSGVYFARVGVGARVFTRKLVLMR
ncbi:MAG: T9SS type A sorting domain-containing protein [Candidatus Marinimicrobia bacterium]|nr:T9SS type A sorting domain-containing protein [Candidatus Neomarinimicrobiota bacterium]